MLVCSVCGHRNEAGANFCSSCGSPLADGDETTATLSAIDSGVVPDRPELGDVPEGAGVFLVRRGPNVGSVFVLDSDRVVAGRHPDSDIFLDDITVSRRHLVVERESGDYAVRDVGSLNGTYVNHERVDHTELHDGDEVQIGRFILSFYQPGA